MVLKMIERIGLVKTSIFLSILPLFISLIIVYIAYSFSGQKVTNISLVLSFTIPSIISPLATYIFLSLLNKLRVTNNKLEQALKEVKELSGMLPICSCCKKIRDDNGYWNQVEEYLSKNTDVLFSHSLCPNCFEEESKKIDELLKEREKLRIKVL